VKSGLLRCYRNLSRGIGDTCFGVVGDPLLRCYCYLDGGGWGGLYRGGRDACLGLLGRSAGGFAWCGFNLWLLSLSREADLDRTGYMDLLQILYLTYLEPLLNPLCRNLYG
jgi:hypothetical protein